VSILSTFYARVFHTKVLFLPKSFCQSQNVAREKLRQALSYKKGERKILMKLTPDVDSIKANLIVSISPHEAQVIKGLN